MIPFKQILAVIFPNGSEDFNALFLKNLLTLCDWWHAGLHVYVPPQERAWTEQRAESIRNTYFSGVEFQVHTCDADRARVIIGLTKSCSCDLVVFRESPAAEGFFDGADKPARAILEGSHAPVLILPNTLEFKSPPVTSFLVPLSGEARLSESLSLTLKIAKQTRTPVNIVHVMTEEEPCPRAIELESLGDEFHHEYAELINKTIAEASPFSSADERNLVRGFWHMWGPTADEISRILRKAPESTLVVEWKGTLEPGHAETLKNFLETFDYPILFVKVRKHAGSRLKLGSDVTRSMSSTMPPT